MDFYGIWDDIRTSVVSCQSWTDAKNALDAFIKARDAKPTGLWDQSVERQYLLPLLRLYFEDMSSFVYDRRRARKAVSTMVRELNSPEVEVLGIIALEGFEAHSQFHLQPGLLLRPIKQDELLELGGKEGGVPVGTGAHDQHLWPSEDWWICEVRVRCPRGNALGWNRVHEINDKLALALRVFKSGGVALGLVTIGASTPFGGGPEGRGGQLKKIAVGKTRYVLSEEESRKFRWFWRRFLNVMERPQHYLQVPIRRHGVAGTRSEKEDALVDYVIGLEALLGKDDERTELSYRFRVRGAVVLAGNGRRDRKKYLRDLRELYNLRSRIVHGQPLRPEDLDTYLPIAEEALRRVWNWYFRRWYEEDSNEAGIESIDADLVS